MDGDVEIQNLLVKVEEARQHHCILVIIAWRRNGSRQLWIKIAGTRRGEWPKLSAGKIRAFQPCPSRPRNSKPRCGPARCTIFRWQLSIRRKFAVKGSGCTGCAT